MTARETTFEPAPAAVARIGSVPIEALESLSDPELAGRAADLDERSFAAEYERVVEEHRKRLWQHTVDDPRVRCGLALSSPSLVADLTDPTPSPRRNKRARHLDTSLYRYLARAAGRLEPCGLWTSVALASLGDEPETTVRPCAPKCHVAPDLVPFRDLVRGLAGLEPYRSRGPYRLNPTLQTGAAGRWCFARRHPDGELSWTTLPVSDAWSLLARHGKDGRPRSMAALTEALRPAVSEAVGRALLRFGLDAGLLVGGLAFPTRFGTPWEALEQVEASLEPSHRASWTTAREQLVRLCADVERALDAALLASPGTAAEHARVVLEGQHCTRVAIEGLAAALELPCPAIPTAVLRCDETAPFGIDLGHHDRRRLEALLRRWSQLERRHHTHHRWVRSAARAIASAQGGVTSMPCTDAERVEAQTVEPSWCGGPPLGALIVRPGASGLRTPWVRGLSQAPTVTHARHAYHLADRGDPLLPWFRAAYRDLERRDGVKAFDLACSTGGSPNLHARPRYVEPALDPWGATSEGPRVDELHVVPGPAPSAVLLAHGGQRWSAHVFTPLRIPSSDVITQRLMATSFDERLVETEASEPDHDQADDVLPRPRTVRLSVAEAEALRAVRGAARFVRWQELVRRHGWSRWVRIQCGTRPALLVPTDGPLPIEAAFEGSGRSEIVVEEVLDGAWLPGPRGHHFVELVLPIRRTPSAWTLPEERDHERV